MSTPDRPTDSDPNRNPRGVRGVLNDLLHGRDDVPPSDDARGSDARTEALPGGTAQQGQPIPGAPGYRDTGGQQHAAPGSQYGAPATGPGSPVPSTPAEPGRYADSPGSGPAAATPPERAPAHALGSPNPGQQAQSVQGQSVQGQSVQGQPPQGQPVQGGQPGQTPTGELFQGRSHTSAPQSGTNGPGTGQARPVPDQQSGTGDNRSGVGVAGVAAAAGAAGAAHAAPRTGPDHTGPDHTGPDHTMQDRTGRDGEAADRATTSTGVGGPGAAPRATDQPSTGSAPVTDRPGEPAGAGSPAGPSAGSDSAGRERLVPEARAQEYATRWDAVKGEFVDEPRQAVRQADALVGELLDELEKLFRDQRQGLEHGLDTDDTSTEDLRLALRRYRSFFDRLLSL